MEYKVKGLAIDENVRNVGRVCYEAATQVALQLAWHTDRTEEATEPSKECHRQQLQLQIL